MKISLSRILVFFLISSFGLMGQNNGASKADFYNSLATSDAQYEQSLQLNSLEDELDYWSDQNKYEESLLEKDSDAYQLYLVAKHMAYTNHQDNCNTQCKHSTMYLKRAAYYHSATSKFQITTTLSVSARPNSARTKQTLQK